MIDYAILCRAIDDWKAGQAPQPLNLGRPASQPTAADDTDGGYGGAQAPVDRTMIYAMPEMVDENGDEVADEETEAEPEDAEDAEMEAEAEADADEDDAEADVEV